MNQCQLITIKTRERVKECEDEMGVKATIASLAHLKKTLISSLPPFYEHICSTARCDGRPFF